MIKKNLIEKRGLSGVVSIVIFVGLAVAAIALIWAVVQGLVEDETKKTESCFNILDKVTINRDYTCYNSGEEELNFSINVGDINLDEVLVSITDDLGTSKSFKISNNVQSLPNLAYPNGTASVNLPEKNSGKTYIYYLGIAGMSIPSSIQIAPVVNGEQCGISDSQNEIDDCSIFV